VTRHLFFWIGLFAGVILATTSLVGVWELAVQNAKDIVTFLFGMIATLGVLLLIVILFRNWFLKKLNLVEASIVEIGESAVRTIGLAAQGRDQFATQEAEILVKSTVGWWAWVSLYRWIIATAIALLFAIGAFAGTILLFEQNQHLESQGERLAKQNVALNWQNKQLASQFLGNVRDQLTIDKVTDQFPSDQRYEEIVGKDTCKLIQELNFSLFTSPNPSITAYVELTASDPDLENEMALVLRSLLRDTNQTVAIGALQVLDDLTSKLVGPKARGRAKARNVHPRRC